MRITGGQAKGRRLAAFRGLDIRPTSDMVRKAIFDLIGQNLEGLKVLDLFAGTGSLGVEALSRGSSKAVFADQSQKSIDLIQKNLRICGLEGKGIMWKGDLVRRFPEKRLLGEKGADLVFIDPPYEAGLVPLIMARLSHKQILAPLAVVVAETRKTEILPVEVEKLHLVKSKKYGETRIHILNYEGG
jgi:16S rRNA (guanine966-N2)-methyltransferase